MKVIICRRERALVFYIYKTNFPAFFLFFKYPWPQAKLTYFNQSNFITRKKKSKKPFSAFKYKFCKIYTNE